MPATVCSWTTDCLPDRPLTTGLALFLMALVVGLALDDYLNGDN